MAIIRKRRRIKRAGGKVTIGQIIDEKFPDKYLSLQTEKTPPFGRFE